MELNKQAIEKVLSSKRLLNLVLSKEPLSEKMWGLDELTNAQVLHVQEVYKRNPKLVEQYLPIDNKKLEESSESISFLGEMFKDEILFSSSLSLNTDEFTFIEFVEVIRSHFFAAVKGIGEEIIFKVCKKKHKRSVV